MTQLRHDFYKHRASPSVPWHSFKKLSDFAENDHIYVFWAETTENNIKNFKKKFVLRYGGKFKNYFRKIPKSITLSKLAPISIMNAQFDWKLNEDFENHHVLYFECMH